MYFKQINDSIIPVFDDMSPEQAKIFKTILYNDNIYTIINAGRRSGKTYISSRLAVALALTCDPTEKILVGAPYQDQATTFFETILDIPNVKHIIAKVKYSDHKKITFVNGVSIDFRTLNNADAVRSKGYTYLFIDEFSFLKNDIYNKAVAPLLAASGNNSRMFLLSTPNGIGNEFHKFALDGELGNNNIEGYEHYKYFHFTWKINPKANEKFILNERKRLAPKAFKQEYLGEFVDSSGDVFENLDLACILTSFEPVKANTRYFAGIDFGKMVDKTVLTILDHNRNVVFVSTYEGDWPIQVKEMSSVLNIYKPICYGEANNMGDAIIGMLKPEYPSLKSMTTTAYNKNDIIEQLKMDIFTSSLKLPTSKLYPVLHEELNNYTFSRTEKTDKLTYHHRTGEHDDHVMSLAIANYAWHNHNKVFVASTTPNSFYDR